MRTPPRALAGRTGMLRSGKAEYLPALTGLRFVLALWVIVHHIAGRGSLLGIWTGTLPLAAQRLSHEGYLAVQTFFILSGFVLARSYLRVSWGRDDLIRYSVARFARVYPVYLVSLAIVSPFMVQTLARPGRTFTGKAALLFDYGFVLQGWNGGLGVGWNTPAWSLSCEIFFYLLFPLLLTGMRSAGWRTAFAVLAAAFVIPVLLAHAQVPWSWKPVHHLSDFAAGIASAKLFEKLRPTLMGRGFWLYIPALVLGILVIIYPRVMEGTYGDVSTALRPLNVAALIGLAMGGGAAARVLSSSAAEYLGKASYSMYILHVPILWWYGHWAIAGSWRMPPLIAAALFIAIVIAASALVFECVEKPVNRIARDWVSNYLCAGELVVARAA
jgi:peptidoglycan/LPS O-acetylase OafA/YrhL